MKGRGKIAGSIGLLAMCGATVGLHVPGQRHKTSNSRKSGRNPNALHAMTDTTKPGPRRRFALAQGACERRASSE